MCESALLSCIQGREKRKTCTIFSWFYGKMPFYAGTCEKFLVFFSS